MDSELLGNTPEKTVPSRPDMSAPRIISPRTPLSCRFLSLLLLLSGTANITEAVIPKAQVIADWMEQWVPLEVSQGSRLLIFLFGLVQVVVSRGVFRGKKTAWLIASAAMGATVLLHLGRAWDWQHAAWSLVLLLVLLRWLDRKRVV